MPYIEYDVLEMDGTSMARIRASGDDAVTLIRSFDDLNGKPVVSGFHRQAVCWIYEIYRDRSVDSERGRNWLSRTDVGPAK